MASGILMPKQGITVESCIISKWYKKVGDKVKIGEPICEFETDKSTCECESTEEGEILELFFNEGDDVPVLINICAVGTKGEDVSALRPKTEDEVTPAEAASTPAPTAETPVAAPAAVTPVVNDGALKISPRARNLALDKNVDARLAQGSGPNGRVIEKDIRALMASGIMSTSAAAAETLGADAGAFTGTGIGGRVSVGDLSAISAKITAAPASNEPEFEDVKFTGIRKAISKSMMASLSSMAQLTNQSHFDATDMMSMRTKFKAAPETMGVGKITLNDILLYAVSRVLLNHKDLNAHLIDGNVLRRFNHVHLGVAVDTPRGLMVPTIKYADTKSLLEISNEAKTLIRAAQAGNINPDLLRDATFTVSNLGSLGVETFTPVINPPQTGILGVGTIVTRVRNIGGELKPYSAMGLSMTYDHRAVDGAPAARFVQELTQALENFSILLAK